MSDPTSEAWQIAVEAAERLIGFYPTITASDPKMYAAGLVQIFSHYPEHLVADALDALNGLPSLHDYPPTMKQVKAFLEPRWQDECRTAERRARFNRKRLHEPQADWESQQRIGEGLKKLSLQLKAGLGPNNS